jgi:hypothetical protein
MHHSESTLMLLNITFMDVRNYQSCSCSRSMNYGEQGVPNSDTRLKYNDNDSSFDITIFKTKYYFFSFLYPWSLSFEIMIITYFNKNIVVFNLMILVHVFIMMIVTKWLKIKRMDFYFDKYLCGYLFNVSFHFCKFPEPTQRIVQCRNLVHEVLIPTLWQLLFRLVSFDYNRTYR